MTWLRPLLPWEGHLPASALAAALPIFFLFWALTIRRMKGWLATLGMLGIGLLVALVLYRMPVLLAGMSVVSGMVFALIPIIWIVVPAVWLYHMSVRSGHFATMTASIVSLTRDMRLQALLVAYLLGSLLEGTAGFGVPVAIGAALLIGMGFEPLKAAVICLLANTAAVAFAGVGIPILALEGPTGYEAKEIAGAVAYLLPCLSAVVPFLIVGAASGVRRTFEIWPSILVVSLSYTVTAALTSALLGPELPALTAAFVSAVCLIIWLRFRKPRNEYILSREGTEEGDSAAGRAALRDVLRSWLPYLVLTGLVFLWSLPTIKAVLSGVYQGDSAFWGGLSRVGEWFSFRPTAPLLHDSITDAATGKAVAVYWKIELLAAAGTAVWLTCLLAKGIYRMSWADAGVSFRETARKLKWSLFIILTVSGYAYLSNLSGMSGTLGQLFAKTGSAFPLVSPLLGWIGVFITGSDTSANLLFGPLQSVTAQSVGMDPVLALAANTVGGGSGKMVSMQSIALAAAAVGLAGKESDMLRKTIGPSLLLVLLVSLVTYWLS